MPRYLLRCQRCTLIGVTHPHVVGEFTALSDDLAPEVADKHLPPECLHVLIEDADEVIPIGEITKAHVRYMRPPKEKAEEPKAPKVSSLNMEHQVNDTVLNGRAVPYDGPLALPDGVVLESSCEDYSLRELCDAHWAHIPSFQEEGVRTALGMDNVLWGDEMGLGKTIQSIIVANTLQRLKTEVGGAESFKVLIVCPNSLRYNWMREWNRWSTFGKLDENETFGWMCITQLFLGMSDVVIASYEGVRRWGLMLEQTEWDLLIVDEAHYCKTPSAQRTISTFRLKATKKLYMTGTPILNFPYELFPLIQSLQYHVWDQFPYFEGRYCEGVGNKMGRNLDELQAKLRGEWSWPHWYVTHKNYKTYDSVPERHRHPGREAQLTVIPQLMIRRLKKDVDLQLPRKRRQIIEIPAEGQLAELVRLERMLWEGKGNDAYVELLKGLDALKDGGENDEAFEALIESLKPSRKFLFEEISRVRHQLALAKVPEVSEHIRTVLDAKDKLVLFCHHKDVARAYKADIDAYLGESNGGAYSVICTGDEVVLERAARVKKFQEDETCRVFIGTMATCREGITLTAAAHIVFAESDWTPSTLTQAEDRCHRIGQERSLLVQHLVVEGSMDAFMMKKIVKKQKTIRRALDSGAHRKEVDW